MWFAIVYLAGLGVGGLCYPRRPRATGIVFMVLGLALMAAWAVGAIAGIQNNILFASGAWVALGARIVWSFRTAESRTAHLVEWTGRSA